MTLPESTKTRFLERLAEHGNASRATAELGLGARTPYQWRDRDPDFARAWEASVDEFRSGLIGRVVDTATAIGVGTWVQATDEAGEPLYQDVLDDGFEPARRPVMRLETDHVDVRVLNKLLDKTMRDEVQRVDQRRQLIGADGRAVDPGPVTLRIVDADGSEISVDPGADER